MKAEPGTLSAYLPDRISALTRQLQQLAGRSTRLSLLRLVAALGGVLGGVGLWRGETGPAAALVATTGALAFVVLVILHQRVSAARDRCARLQAFLEARQKGAGDASSAETTWAPVDSAVDALEPHDAAAIALDLDVDGPAGLMARHACCVSLTGNARFRSWLLTGARPPEALQRRVGIQALIAQPRHLEAWAALRPLRGQRPDPGSLRAWAQRTEATQTSKPAPTSRPAQTPNRAQQRVLWALPAVIVFIAMCLMEALAPTGGLWRLGWVALLVYNWAALSLQPPREVANSAVAIADVALTRDAWALMAQAPPAALAGHSVAQHGRYLRRLAWAMALAEVREQPLAHIPLNLLLQWDTWVHVWLTRLRRAGREALPAIVEAIADFDALTAGAWTAGTLEGASWPTLHDEPDQAPSSSATGFKVAGFKATALTHPLLPAASRVANDVNVSGHGSVLLVTGSNMAGKSTLLRAIGLNVLMARAGLPATAASLTLTPLRLRTSMRVVDSLSRGESHFAAEVARVGTLIANLEASPPAFFLIDELFRGTNTEARQAASAAVLRHLLAHGALGAFATHDVSIVDDPALGAFNVTPIHFRDVLVDGEMRFDYKAQPGVVTHSNALAIVERLGIDVSPVSQRA